MVIFLSNFLALLIKADAAGDDSRSFLGGVMVAVNVLLIVAVLSASCLTTQQEVGDHLDGNNAVAVAGTMLTFEQRKAANAWSDREQMTASLSSAQTRGGCTTGVEDFNTSERLTASIGHGVSPGLRVDGTRSAAVPDLIAVPTIRHAFSDEEHLRRSSLLTRPAFARVPRFRMSPTKAGETKEKK